MRALQQLTTKCKWRLISIVLEFDWASHIIYEVIIQGVTMEKKHPLSQPSRLHYFQIFFEWLGNFYPFINISTTGFCFSLSLSRLWKLVFIYTKSTKNQRIKNVLFVGFFFSNLKKTKPVGLEMVGIFFAVIFHQMLVLTESVVLHLELFLLGEIEKRKTERECFTFQNGSAK